LARGRKRLNRAMRQSSEMLQHRSHNQGVS
jgi:hypothetical protein